METKIVLVGDGGVGKSTFTRRLIFNSDFDCKYIPTIGFEVYPWNHYIFWDTAGQDKFGGLRDTYYINANIAIIMVDATSKITSKSIKNWYDDLIRFVPNIRVAIIVNKIDCESISKESVDYAKSFSEEKEIPYMEITCKGKMDKDKITEFIQNI